MGKCTELFCEQSEGPWGPGCASWSRTLLLQAATFTPALLWKKMFILGQDSPFALSPHSSGKQRLRVPFLLLRAPDEAHGVWELLLRPSTLEGQPG